MTSHRISAAILLSAAALGIFGRPVAAQAIPPGAAVIKDIDVGSGFGELGVEQPNGDDAPVLPLGIAVLPNEGVIILDNVNLRLIRVSFDGSQLTVRNALPAGSGPTDIVARSGELYILDGENVRVIQPGRSGGRSLTGGGRSLGGAGGTGAFVAFDEGAEPEIIPPVPDSPSGRGLGGQGGFALRAPTFFNHGEQFVPTARGFSVSPQGVRGRSFERPDRASDFSVAPSADTHPGVNVVGARILWKSPDARSSDVYVEELDTSADGLPVRTAVRRYQRSAGRTTGPMQFAAIAPLGEVRYGRNPVASDGTHAYQLQPVVNSAGRVTKFRLLKIKFSPVAPAPSQPGQTPADAPTREPTVSASQHPWPRAGRGPLASQPDARRKREEFCATASGGAATQEAVLAKVIGAGNAFSRMAWRVNAATMGPSSCRRPGDWQRPPHLEGSSEGDQARGMPYGWGNFDTVDDFKRKVEQRGVRGGSVCTKDQAIPNTAGIDCSGFVHRALSLDARGKLSTISMQGHMIDLGSYSAMRPGDVLLDPGSHVMFYLGVENGYVKTVESTKGCPGTFQGVCYNLRSFASIGSYRPARPATNCAR